MNTEELESRLFDDPGYGRARKLLELCGPAASSPFETLLSRLEAPDGGEWGEGALASATPEGSTDAASIVADGAGGLEGATSLKLLGKARMKHAESDEHRSEAVLLYTLAIGSALHHHGATITSRPAGTVAEHLIGLAGLLPARYARVAECAAERLWSAARRTG